MKARFKLLVLVPLLFPAARILAATTIDPANHFAWGANVGWMDWAADGANGVVLGQYSCSGYIYAANVGWINLGSGSPANQIQYQNNSAADFGVNQDGFGNLRGYAYGANIGWVNFESQGAPQIDLLTGHLTGYVWSANCGWISLNNAFAYVQTDSLSPGPLDSNGLPIAWELTHFGHTGVNPNADPDADGTSNYQEYIAGTDPNTSSDVLRIIQTAYGAGSRITITWQSTPARLYYIQKSARLNPATWTDSGLGLIAPDSGTTTSRSFIDTSGHYYRVQAVLPLSP